MHRLRIASCLLLGVVLQVGCVDQQEPTAPSTRPLGSVAEAVSDSLFELSRPNAVGECDDGFGGGAWSVDHAEEPFVAVSPVNPNNIVAAWIQGPFQDIVAAASFDGGKTWKRVPVPLTTCAGGQFLIAGDVWLSFAPDGSLYGIALAGNALSSVLPEVLKSTDGGLHWTVSVPPGSSNVDPPADHPSITADPTNASFVYAIWDGTKSPHSGAAVFSRSTDGGSTWERPRALVEAASQSFIQFSQILVLPNGTLVDLYEFYAQQPNGPITQTTLRLLRSTDHGQSWTTPFNAVAMTPLYRSDGETLVLDQETGQFVQDPTNPSFSVDMQNGNLYAVWEDGRFSNFQYNDIAFSMSADGGSSWSTPIRVNETPLDIPAANRQAFLPSVAVAANGTIGVSYYDFRFNDPNPGLRTDRWLVQCHPGPNSTASDRACWTSEARLTNSAFNMESVAPTFISVTPDFAGSFFLGDYFGLASARNDFVATFTQPDGDNVTSVFFTRSASK